MNKKTLLLLILVLVFLTGCATTGAHDGMGTDPSLKANIEPICWVGFSLFLILGL